MKSPKWSQDYLKMSVRIFNENDKRKWNVAIHLDNKYDTWYSYRFNKYYCGEPHGIEVKCICAFATQEEYISHMIGAHDKIYKNPNFVVPKLPRHIIISNDELYVKSELADSDLD